MSQGSSNNQVEASRSLARPSCNHGRCKLYTSHTAENPGKRFWRCPRWNEGGCRRFEWFDEGAANELMEKRIDNINDGEMLAAATGMMTHKEGNENKEEPQSIQMQMNELNRQMAEIRGRMRMIMGLLGLIVLYLMKVCT